MPGKLSQIRRLSEWFDEATSSLPRKFTYADANRRNSPGYQELTERFDPEISGEDYRLLAGPAPERFSKEQLARIRQLADEFGITSDRYLFAPHRKDKKFLRPERNPSEYHTSPEHAMYGGASDGKYTIGFVDPSISNPDAKWLPMPWRGDDVMIAPPGARFEERPFSMDELFSEEGFPALLKRANKPATIDSLKAAAEGRFVGNTTQYLYPPLTEEQIASRLRKLSRKFAGGLV